MANSNVILFCISLWLLFGTILLESTNNESPLSTTQDNKKMSLTDWFLGLFRKATTVKTTFSTTMKTTSVNITSTPRPTKSAPWYKAWTLKVIIIVLCIFIGVIASCIACQTVAFQRGQVMNWAKVPRTYERISRTEKPKEDKSDDVAAVNRPRTSRVAKRVLSDEESNSKTKNSTTQSRTRNSIQDTRLAGDQTVQSPNTTVSPTNSNPGSAFSSAHSSDKIEAILTLPPQGSAISNDSNQSVKSYGFKKVNSNKNNDCHNKEIFVLVAQCFSFTVPNGICL